jgi:hypothetical protein
MPQTQTQEQTMTTGPGKPAQHGRPLRRDPPTPRLRRAGLTPQELFRLEEYGSIHFESAGATRKR